MLAALALFASQAKSANENWPPAPGTAPSELASRAAWPDDPLFGYRTGILASERASGQWPLYSFLPERSNGAPERETLEEAAGSSVDRAWTQTIGSRRVTIALIGTGVDWSEPDLVGRLSLSIGELRARPPLHADGTPCAPLDFQQPGQDLFDCDSDGQLTVADYAEHPGLLPEASGQRPRGDANGNGVLDAQDLLLQLMDGIDNDDNGYVDDIVGWDFAADDNDPTDAFGRAETTLQAVIAAGDANNGEGRAGVCPRCRLLPLRVGDELLSEPQRLGEAITYAVDRGALVVYFAVESLGATEFIASAVDYAARHGAVVIVASGAQNSRAQRPLTTLNRSVTVGGISLLGEDQQSTTARSYVAFDTCGNFGAQLLVSAPSPDCAQEGASLVAGVTGLMHAAAFQAGYDPELPGGTSRLSASELGQLMATSADDVFVLDSARADSSHYASQPGFDQRFGFGRVNAFGAVDAIVRGRIPPEITLTLPRWFETFNEATATAPLRFLGTIGARRAAQYSYVIDWAPGVEPRESDFTELKRASNVAAAVVTGDDGAPLAELDIRNLELASDDNKGTPGENARSITVRIRATAHYAGAIGDANGELRRSFNVVDDKDLMEGFPLRVGAMGRGGPKLADIDGDGARDIVVSTLDGRVEAFSLASGRPERIPGFPLRTASRDSLAPSEPRIAHAPAYRDGLLDPGIARQAIFGAPALADLNADGALDVVVATADGVIYAFSNEGKLLEGWPVTLPEVLPCDDAAANPDRCSDSDNRIARGALASPVIADVDADSELEIVQAGLDGYLHAFEVSGEIVDGFPHRVHHENARPRPLTTSPAIGDFDGDGRAELLIGSAEQLDGSEKLGAFTLLRASNGRALQNWPVSVETRSLEPLIGEGAAATPLAADIDGNGRADAVIHGNGGTLWVLPANPGIQTDTGKRPSNALPAPKADAEATDDSTELPVTPFASDQVGVAAPSTLRGPLGISNFQAAAGDLNQDGLPDIAAAGAETALLNSLGKVLPRADRGRHVLVMYDGRTGAIVPTTPSVLEDTPELSAPAIADITGDGYPEVVVGSAGYRVQALDACGRSAPQWPKQTGQWVVGAPAVGDIDGNGRLDVVVTTRNGWVFAWSTPGPADGVIAWESTHHDLRNTSNYETPLDQGTLRSSAPPLAYAADGACVTEEQPPQEEPEPRLRARGGCSLRPQPGRGWRSNIVAVLGLLLLLRRSTRSAEGRT